MKVKFLRKLFLFFGLISASHLSAETVPSVYDLMVKDISGNDVALSQYRGKVALIVNTASQCGFTPQYESLETLYDEYRGREFVILGFPSNDFGGQEPGSNQEIKKFCETKFGVKFPLFAKGPVKGDEIQPLFKLLTEGYGEDLSGSVRWNFEKFLVNKNGVLVSRFRSFTSPLSDKIKKEIDTLLVEHAASEETPH